MTNLEDIDCVDNSFDGGGGGGGGGGEGGGGSLISFSMHGDR